jgi:hypothetical protein
VVLSPVAAAALGGATCLLLSARKAGTEALRVDDSTTWVGGEAGALTTLPKLDTEDMEE